MPHEKRTAGSAAGGLLGFIGLSVAAGILVTAAVTPALAITGMAANNAIGVFDSLPSFLEIDPPMERTTIVATAADGSTKELASFYDQNRVQVAWDEVSQNFKDAAVAAEDPRFYEHGGVDIIGTTRAVLSNYIGSGRTQGGSSITQQYVKNVLVQKAEQITDSKASEAAYAEATDPTTERKLKEMRFSIGLEQQYTKDQILLGYLNIANFGGQAYGVEAASQYYFGVSAKDANIAQAATLIAILNEPSSLRVDQPKSEKNGEANGYALTLDRRDYVITKMYEEKKITKEAYDAAIASKIEPKITPVTTGCQAAGGAAYFCSYVQHIILNDEAFGADTDERQETLRRGGMTVYTSLDPDIQAAAQTAMDTHMQKDSTRADFGAAAVTVQPKTGRVLAMVQNRNFTEDREIAKTSNSYTAINFNTDINYGGSSGFQVGSQYKIFTLVDWLKNGHSVNESVDASKHSYTRWTDSCSEGGVYTTKPWSPKNYDGNASGRITALNATKRSVNTAFVNMASQLDLCDIQKVASSLGVHRADGQELPRNPATLLGAVELAPLSMATSVAAIGAQGQSCTPIAIDKIVLSDGKERDVPKSTCTQAITPEVANTAAYAMRSVFSPGGTGANAMVSGADLFGKTGTSDFAYDTWITGGTPAAVTSLWVGNVQALNGRKTSMYNLITNKGYSGYQAKYRVFKAIAQATVTKLGSPDYPAPADSLIVRKQVAVPDVTGKTVAEAKSILNAAGFNSQTGPAVTSKIDSGLVASTNPGAGSLVSNGNTITINPSNGTGETMPNVVGQKAEDAKKTLEKMGFTVQEACSADPELDKSKEGIVATQSPAAGNTVTPKGANASITFSKLSC